jgi:hypothetical protein
MNNIYVTKKTDSKIIEKLKFSDPRDFNQIYGRTSIVDELLKFYKINSFHVILLYLRLIFLITSALFKPEVSMDKPV